MKTRIYCLKDINNNIRYIGKTIQTLNNRLNGHLSPAKNKNNNDFRARWVLKCLKNGYKPIIELILETDTDGSFEEQLIIDICKQFNINLTNATIGGEGTIGYKHTQEAKNKISKKCNGRISSNLGKKLSKKTRKLISEARKGYKCSESTKKKISIATTGQNNPLYGKRHNKNTIKIMSEKAKNRYLNGKSNPFYGKKHSKESIIKAAISRGSKEFICEQTGKKYILIKEAAKEFNIWRGTISKFLLGKTSKKIHGTYTFRYV